MAGRGWYDLFMRRHKDILSVRKPTGTSKSRVHGFTKAAVNEFFNLLMEAYEKHKFPASRIYNVDETGKCLEDHTGRGLVCHTNL
jgi:hypothetical protein